MTSDNPEEIELAPSLIGLEYQFLNASILLGRWSKWASTFGSLVHGQEDFVQLQKDTDEFFNSHKKR